jgi:hypothetical protein
MPSCGCKVILEEKNLPKNKIEKEYEKSSQTIEHAAKEELKKIRKEVCVTQKHADEVGAKLESSINEVAPALGKKKS